MDHPGLDGLPALSLDGRNWKTYRAKLLEFTATARLLDIIAGRKLDDGSDVWEMENAQLMFIVYSTIPRPFFLQTLHLQTARELFSHLANRFGDSSPIVERDSHAETVEPETHENGGSAKLVHAETIPQAFERAGIAAEGHDDVRAPAADGRGPTMERETRSHSEESRSSQRGSKRKTAAPEGLTSAEVRVADTQGTDLSRKVSDEEDDLPKVQLHEPRNKSQDAPSSKPPVEGEPCECERQPTKAVVAAEGASEIVEIAEEVAEVDRMALPGGDLAKSEPGVDSSDKRANRRRSRPQQAKLCLKDSHRSGNATEHIPNAHGVPLEGEWTGCASGSASGRKVLKELQKALSIHETRKSDKTHRTNANAIRSLRNTRKRYYGSPTRRRRRGRIKIVPVDVSQTPRDETTYHANGRATQTLGNAQKCIRQVIRPRRRRGRLKPHTTIVSRTFRSQGHIPQSWERDLAIPNHPRRSRNTRNTAVEPWIQGEHLACHWRRRIPTAHVASTTRRQADASKLTKSGNHVGPVLSSSIQTDICSRPDIFIPYFRSLSVSTEPRPRTLGSCKTGHPLSQGHARIHIPAYRSRSFRSSSRWSDSFRLEGECWIYLGISGN